MRRPRKTPDGEGGEQRQRNDMRGDRRQGQRALRDIAQDQPVAMPPRRR